MAKEATKSNRARNLRGSKPPGRRSRPAAARWQQVVAQVEQDIRDGKYVEGERLPKEAELARHYKVSRHTLRRSIAELAKLGLAEVTPRMGVRVSHPRVTYAIDTRSSYSRNIQDAGRRPGAELLRTSEGIAPSEIADLLGVAKRTPVLEFYILRTANELPMALQQVWLPADRFSRIGDLFSKLGSFERALEQLGIKEQHRAGCRVGARPATADERRRLRLQQGAVVLTMLAVEADRSGEPIKASRTVFPAERIELIVGS